MIDHFNHKYYFINKFDTNVIDYQDKKTVIIYRNYCLKKVDKNLIIKIKNYCKKKGKKFYLANNIKMAIKLGLDGAYLPSFNRNFNHLSYSFKRKFIIVGSAHNLKEIRIKEIQTANKIFLSSLFKRNKNFLGIYRFKLLSKLTKKKIVILGGITDKNIRSLGLFKNPEFAGISYFDKKKAPKKGPFLK